MAPRERTSTALTLKRIRRETPGPAHPPSAALAGVLTALDIVRRAFTDAQGRFAFDPCPEGLWEMHIPAPSFTSKVLLWSPAPPGYRWTP